MTFKYLTVLFTVLMLLFIADGKWHLHAFEAIEFHETANLKEIIQIQFKNDTLTVATKDAGLIDILKEVARKTGLEINIYGIINEKQTLQFKDLPLEDGLKRILKNQNYSFGYLKKRNAAGTNSIEVLSSVFLLNKITSNHKRGGFGQQSAGNLSDAHETIRTKFLENSPMEEERLRAVAETIKNRIETFKPKLDITLEQIRQETKHKLWKKGNRAKPEIKHF